MKYKIEKAEERNRLPEVGECFRFTGVGEVYMRINDVQGAKTMSLTAIHHHDLFYSVNLKSGEIVRVCKHGDDIVLLESDCVFRDVR